MNSLRSAARFYMVLTRARRQRRTITGGKADRSRGSRRCHMPRRRAFGPEADQMSFSEPRHRALPTSCWAQRTVPCRLASAFLTAGAYFRAEGSINVCPSLIPAILSSSVTTRPWLHMALVAPGATNIVRPLYRISKSGKNAIEAIRQRLTSNEIAGPH